MTNRIELSITHRSPFAAAHEFGPVGAYERLVGRANFPSIQRPRRNAGSPISTRPRPTPVGSFTSPVISRS